MNISSLLFASAVVLVCFSASLSSAQPRQRVLHRFHDHPAWGGTNSRLLMDGNGNMIGATFSAIYELTPSAGGNWTYHVVFNFNGRVLPYGTLARDTSGNVYGVTDQDIPNYVFGLTPTKKGYWKATRVYSNDYSLNPGGGLAIDSQGNLFGTSRDPSPGGVFELSPDGQGHWKYQKIYNFTASEGLPYTSLVFDHAGNLYGATYLEVYELTPGSGGWNETVIHTFDPNKEGDNPQGSDLVFDSAGNLYGTTSSSVYELSPNGNSWTLSVLHKFHNNGHDGVNPSSAGVFLDGKGDVYGTTYYGGTNNKGVVYELIPGSNGHWSERIVHSFTDGLDGGYPEAGFTMDSGGNLYSQTTEGGDPNCGQEGCGVIFEIKP